MIIYMLLVDSVCCKKNLILDFEMTKCKKVVLSIEEKLKVCEIFRNKIPKADMMLKYSIGKSTVNDFIKKEESLKNFKMGKSELVQLQC